MILIFLYLGGSMATFGAYYIIPSSDYRTATLKILTMIVSIVFSFSIPILLYNQIKRANICMKTISTKDSLTHRLIITRALRLRYELRKIRHDYNDLSIGLKSLINSRKYDEVLPLLQKYDSEIISSFQILYNTGNDLTDAILSDKQKMQMKILKSHLRVLFQMCLPTTLKSAFCLTIWLTLRLKM